MAEIPNDAGDRELPRMPKEIKVERMTRELQPKIVEALRERGMPKHFLERIEALNPRDMVFELIAVLPPSWADADLDMDEPWKDESEGQKPEYFIDMTFEEMAGHDLATFYNSTEIPHDVTVDAMMRISKGARRVLLSLLIADYAQDALYPENEEKKKAEGDGFEEEENGDTTTCETPTLAMHNRMETEALLRMYDDLMAGNTTESSPFADFDKTNLLDEQELAEYTLDRERKIELRRERENAKKKGKNNE